MRVKRFDAADLKCVEVTPQKGGEGLPLVIGLHGWGDTGENYTDLAAELGESEYQFVFPTAPLPVPGAYFGWFPIEDLNGVALKALQPREQLNRLLEVLSARYELSAERIFLFGFSQGAMMTLDVGLRYRGKNGKHLAGLASLSGLLLADTPFRREEMINPVSYYEGDRGDLKSVLNMAASDKIPVLVTHGTYDPVVPVIAGRAAYTTLEKAGLEVEYYEFQGAHQIVLPELLILQKFIAKCLLQPE